MCCDSCGLKELDMTERLKACTHTVMITYPPKKGGGLNSQNSMENNTHKVIQIDVCGLKHICSNASTVGLLGMYFC